MAMTASSIFVVSLGLAAAAIFLLGGALVWRVWRMQKAEVRLEEVVQEYADSRLVLSAGSSAESANAEELPMQRGVLDTLGVTAPSWLNAGWAKALLPDEERVLLDQAGLHLQQSATLYVSSRAVLCLVLPLLGLSLLNVQGFKVVMVLFFGFGVGLMLPKWVLQSKVSQRRKRISEELPVFVDMLRLLQGVGLSVDQSLHILASEFQGVLRVISPELQLANRLYATGRSREQSFHRLVVLSQDDDMSAVVNLLMQVDKHGGAVQEPLAQFALRLREKRQAAFKEKIGTITVKMTGVMVLTLLPALIVITAGPGFMAVMRSLSSVK